MNNLKMIDKMNTIKFFNGYLKTTLKNNYL